jgi:allantoin racemase
MKIAYLVPNPFLDVQETTRRGELLKEWAFPNTEVNIVCVTEGPVTLESKYEEYLSISATAKEISRLEKEGYDATILGCAVDPGLDAMREITTKMLVVGMGEASVLTAAMLGHKFSIITIYESMINTNEELVYKAGVLDKLASVRALKIAVLDLSVNRKSTLEKIIRVSQKAIENDGADCLVLGCGSMGFLNVAEEISNYFKIPVINPPKIALKMAESLVSIGLMHSKKAFALPPKLALGKVNNINQLII